MAARRYFDALNDCTIEVKQEMLLEGLRKSRSESSVRSTLDEGPAPLRRAASADLPIVSVVAQSASSGVLDNPPNLPSSVSVKPLSPELSCTSCGETQEAALIKPELLFCSKSTFKCVRCAPTSTVVNPVLGGSARPAGGEIQDIEDEGFGNEEEARKLAKLPPYKQPLAEEPKLQNTSRPEVIEARDLASSAPVGHKPISAPEESEALPPVPTVTEQACSNSSTAEEPIIDGEKYMVFPSMAAFEDYGRKRILAAHPEVAIEKKASPHTLTLSCRNRRKEYTSCPFLLRAREEYDEESKSFTGKFRLEKGTEDETVGHNAACLARLLTKSASASKNVSPACTPPKSVQVKADMPPAAIVVKPSIDLVEKACSPPLKPAPSASSSIPSLPAIKLLPNKRKKRVIAIESDSEDEEVPEMIAVDFKPNASPGSDQLTPIDSDGTSDEEETAAERTRRLKRKWEQFKDGNPKLERRYRLSVLSYADRH